MHTVKIVGQSATKGDLPIKTDDDGNLIIQLEGATVNIGDVDIASPLGDQAKAASVSVTPATDIPATRQLGKVAIDQATPNANEVVVKTSALPSGAATEQGLDDILAKLPDQIGGKTPVVQAATPDTATGDLAKITAIDTAVGAKTDAPYVGTEDATARGLISLLKGIKNHIYALAGCVTAGISVACGWNNFVTDPVELTLTTAGAYLANETFQGTLVEIPNVALAAGRGGIIDMVRLSLNEAGKTPRIRCHFFNANNPTLGADNAGWVELAADSAKRVGYIDMQGLSSATGAATDCSRSQEMTNRTSLRYKCAAGSTSLWVGFEPLDGVTITAGKKLSIVVKGEMG